MKDKIVGIAYDYSAKNNKERRAKEKEVKSFIKFVEKNYLNKKPLEKKQRERSDKRWNELFYIRIWTAFMLL